jgi:hypothetical protein
MSRSRSGAAPLRTVSRWNTCVTHHQAGTLGRKSIVLLHGPHHHRHRTTQYQGWVVLTQWLSPHLLRSRWRSAHSGIRTLGLRLILNITTTIHLPSSSICLARIRHLNSTVVPEATSQRPPSKYIQQKKIQSLFPMVCDGFSVETVPNVCVDGHFNDLHLISSFARTDYILRARSNEVYVRNKIAYLPPNFSNQPDPFLQG